MSNARFFSAIALTALVTATLVSGLTLARPARADAGHPAVCTTIGIGSAPVKTAEWMNAEIAQGYANFSHTELYTGPVLVCAW